MMNPTERARILARLRPFKSRSVSLDRAVRVHRNLASSTWSVLQGGLVVAHADVCMLRDVRFIVSAAGHARARRTGRRRVYAWAEGILAGSGMGVLPEETSSRPLPARIELDRERGAFVCRNLTADPFEVKSTLVAAFDENGCSAAYTERAERHGR